MKSKNPKEQLISIFDKLIDSEKFINPHSIIKKIENLSKKDPELASVFVQLILLIESARSNDISKALESESETSLNSLIKLANPLLLLRTSLTSCGIFWIIFGGLQKSDISSPGWLVLLGVILLVTAQIKKRISLKREVFQILSVMLTNLSVFFMTEKSLQIIVATIIIGILSAILMLIFISIDRILSTKDE